MPATGNLSVLRALRILRVLRLVSAFSSIRHVVTGLLNAIPGMGSILFLLVLINYIFAVLTTKLYGANFPKFFGTIGASFYTLFQIMTLEGWSGDVVRPVMAKHPFAWVVFVPYTIVVTFAVLNLFIGIVVDAMQSQNDKKRDEESQREYNHIISEIRELRGEVRALRRPETIDF
jgi:voltage-gated sodium channel